ncbi:MAG TPA: hypothetical protein VMV53_00610 [Acidimicrobiales bacterium]|nr:hypothetical protein [Acidimicrobiales bacterium]
MSSIGDGYVIAQNPLSDFVQYGDTNDPLFIDTSRLAHFGYGTSLGDFLNPNGTLPVMRIDTGKSPEQSLVNKLSPQQRERYTVAYGGRSPVRVQLADGKTFFTTPGGCEGMSFGRIYGITKRDWGILHYTKVYTLAQDVIEGVVNQVEASTSYQSAMTQWSTCMSARGFAFSNRNFAFASLVRRYQSNQSRFRSNERHEMIVARADAYCSVNAKLNEVSEQQVTHRVEIMPEIQISALKQWRFMQLSAIRNALSVTIGASK